MGEEVTEQLDIIPAKVRVLRHVRLKYACKHCDTPPHTAPMPPQPIPKSQVSPGFLAYVIISKYADALPLYRQCHILSRGGVDVARNTLCQQVVKAGELIQPLINLLQDQALSYPVLQMDETTVQVLNEPGKAADSPSYMWVMRGGPPGQSSLIYHYDPGRGKAVPKRLLADYQGYLQTDAWHAYDAVHSDAITAVGCWAHARRKFKEAQKALPKSQQKRSGRIEQALSYIQKLYAVETRVRDADNEKRHDARQQDSVPVLDAFHTWLLTQNPNPESRLGKAINYTLTYWDRLTVYCTDGRLEIDNNRIENKIRPFAVGRKNWLFSTSQAGAKASANLYSLIETAKANGLNEYDYLKWVFAKLPAANTVDDIETLLPWNIDVTELVNWVYA
ncbi:MAG: IS66 family transposase [Gammaproteobacteria bacterium]|nr:IS66 family transposase [Gammaproteobacteria bacterium]